MRMHLEGVKNGSSVPPPESIVGEVTVMTANSALSNGELSIPPKPEISVSSEPQVSIPPITSENRVRKACAAIWATSVPAAIARIVAINKLFTLLAQASAAALAIGIGRRTYYQQ